MQDGPDAPSDLIPYFGMRSAQRVGRALRDARTSACLMQADVADASGVPRETISAIENGSRDVRLGTLVPVLRALGYEIAFLPADPSPMVAHRDDHT